MKQYYSKSTGGFYRDDLNASMPADVVEVTDAQRLAVLGAPAGKQIQPDANGIPMLVTPVLSLTDAQAAQIAQLSASYAEAISQNVTYKTVGGITQVFQAGPGSISSLHDMLSAYQNTTPSGFYWVAADNTEVPFTRADLEGLANAIGDQGWAAFQNLKGKKDAVRNATTVAAVQAVVW